MRPLWLSLVLAASSATALDWKEPWNEPRVSAATAAAAATASDEYAWRLFVALSWPTNPRTRAADASAPLGAERPVVWQSWINARAVYRDDGADPGPWSARSELPAAERFETALANGLPNLRHIVAGRMVPVTDPIESARRLTEIHLNRASYELIRARQLFNVEGQQRAYADRRAVSFPYGAREVKAKWRPIEASERARYYTMAVTLDDGSQRLYGLTGLHVASKDLPNWFWATFEQVDNPGLPDNEGWQLPSRDRFACGKTPPDCNRAPVGIGIEGTVWQYYRLRGTLTAYTDDLGAPLRLANSELESGMQQSASCITCHSRAAVRLEAGHAAYRPIFDSSGTPPGDPLERRGFIGAPTWLGGSAPTSFRSLDFVWSMTLAKHDVRDRRSEPSF